MQKTNTFGGGKTHSRATVFRGLQNLLFCCRNEPSQVFPWKLSKHFKTNAFIQQFSTSNSPEK